MNREKYAQDNLWAAVDALYREFRERTDMRDAQKMIATRLERMAHQIKTGAVQTDGKRLENDDVIELGSGEK